MFTVESRALRSVTKSLMINMRQITRVQVNGRQVLIHMAQSDSLQCLGPIVLDYATDAEARAAFVKMHEVHAAGELM